MIKLMFDGLEMIVQQQVKWCINITGIDYWIGDFINNTVKYLTIQ